ncbi:MAG TPA: O-antigen ligase family protein, partial [Myxococcota bacterium]
MPERGSSQRFEQRLADGIAVAATSSIGVLPLLIGGVHPQVAAGFAVSALVLLVGWVACSARVGRPVTTSWLVLPFVVGAIVTAIEVLPLPPSVLSVVAASTTQMRAFIVAGLPEALRADVLPVISMDPPESKAALLRLIGAAAIFVVISNAARKRERARLIWRTIIVAGAVVFVVALGHAVVGVPAWGMFGRHTGIFFAPIVNANHQSKVFAALALLCLGRALSCRERREAFAAGVVGVLCGVAVPLTLSRGGMLAFAAAGVLGGALVWRARRREHDDDIPGGQLALPAVAVAMMAVVVAALAIADRAIVDEIVSLQTDSEQVERSKIALWSPALSLLDEHVVSGVGNNAFAMAFTARSTPHTMYDAELTFSHVENIVVGTLVEHGAVVGGFLVVLAAFVGLRLLQLLQSRAEIAAVPAVFVLAIGDVVDFALESTAGIALMATALALCAASLDEGRRWRSPVWAACIVVAVGLVAAHAPAAVSQWRYRLDRALQTSTSPAARQAVLHQMLVARPFDGYACTQLAVDARHRRQPREALAWANRAINLWPTLPEAHLEAARALAATGHVEQAMLEYREAAQGADGAALTVLAEAFSRSPDPVLRRRALPDAAWALSLLCRAFVREQRAAEASACADELASRADASDDHRVEPLRRALDANDATAIARAAGAVA